MVILLVILSIILMIAIDYAIQRKKGKMKRTNGREVVQSLWKIARNIPEGIFLQPSFTWTRILDTGEVAVGIQPVLLALIGKPDEVIPVKTGMQMEKGDVLVTLRKGDRELHIRSPIAGTVLTVQSGIADEGSWETFNRKWLFVLKPRHISREIPAWYIGEEALAWTEEGYRRLRDFFTTTLPPTDMGFTLADGGDIPAGILSHYDQKTWEEFEAYFLN